MGFRLTSLFSICLVLLQVTSSIPAVGQISTEEIIEKFFNDYQNKSSRQALNNLYRIRDEDRLAMNNYLEMIERLDELPSVIGKYYGYEIVDSGSLGTHMKVYSVIAFFNNQPIQFIFQFYRPMDEWKVHSFTCHDRVDDEFENSMEKFSSSSGQYQIQH